MQSTHSNITEPSNTAASNITEPSNTAASASKRGRHVVAVATWLPRGIQYALRSRTFYLFINDLYTLKLQSIFNQLDSTVVSIAAI